MTVYLKVVSASSGQVVYSAVLAASSRDGHGFKPQTSTNTCGHICRYVDQKGSAAMLTSIQSQSGHTKLTKILSESENLSEKYAECPHCLREICILLMIHDTKWVGKPFKSESNQCEHSCIFL